MKGTIAVLLFLLLCGMVYAYEVVPTQGYVLTVSMAPSGAGSVALNPSGGTYAAGIIVQVTASPADSYSFSVWTLDGSNVSSANPYSVTMNANHNLKANFVTGSPPPTSYTLTTSVSPSGSGSISLNPPGGTYPAGSTVQATANPIGSYTFSIWTLDGSNVSSANPYSVTMNANRNLKANFASASPPPSGNVLAGWRCAEYDPPYGRAPSWFVSHAQLFQSKISGSSAAGVWVIGYIEGNGYGDSASAYCYLSFPHSGSVTNVHFGSSDSNENYLNAFDAAGMKVWLQVEPADADVNTLCDLVMTQYSHHSCVIGFGIDGEWYHARSYQYGQAESSSLVQGWVNHLHSSWGASYKFFTKHFDSAKLPTVSMSGLVYIDDSCSFGGLSEMVSDFSAFAGARSGSDIGLQFGYTVDYGWWHSYADPYSTISAQLLSNIGNCKELFWTCEDILAVYP